MIEIPEFPEDTEDNSMTIYSEGLWFILLIWVFIVFLIAKYFIEDNFYVEHKNAVIIFSVFWLIDIIPCYLLLRKEWKKQTKGKWTKGNRFIFLIVAILFSWLIFLVEGMGRFIVWLDIKMNEPSNW